MELLVLGLPPGDGTRSFCSNRRKRSLMWDPEGVVWNGRSGNSHSREVGNIVGGGSFKDPGGRLIGRILPASDEAARW